MHSVPALTDALAPASRRAVGFWGLAFRAIHLKHFVNLAAAQPLFCAAGGTAGSRYVPPHGPAALYLALDADTAYRDLNQAFYQTGKGPTGRTLVRTGLLRPVPCVTLGVHVRVSRLLNLTRSGPNWRAVRALLGIRTRSNTELLGPWVGVPNAPTQVLGKETFESELFEGIMYPSAQNLNHTCLVIFRDRLLPSSWVHFHDATTDILGQLP